MEKRKTKTRDIHFFSKKNNQMMCVHTELARKYAQKLEESEDIASYEVNVLLDRSRYSNVSQVDIRKEYFRIEWVTDFLLHFQNGQTGIRELSDKEVLPKRAIAERLEFSRRYWEALHVQDWKIIVMDAGGTE